MFTASSNIHQRAQFGNNMNNRGRESLFGNRNTVNNDRGGRQINDVQTEQARTLLEEQNNEQINHLSLQINTLKQLTTNIHGEVIEQNRLLDGMGRDFDNTDDLLGGTLKKLGTMMDRNGGRHMWYLIGFVVFVFILLYYIIRGY